MLYTLFNKTALKVLTITLQTESLKIVDTQSG